MRSTLIAVILVPVLMNIGCYGTSKLKSKSQTISDNNHTDVEAADGAAGDAASRQGDGAFDPQTEVDFGDGAITGLQLYEACQSTEESGMKRFTTTLNFPGRSTCSSGGGIGGLQGFSEENHAIRLPTDAMGCGMTITSMATDTVGADQFLYDDVEFLTVADYLIATTHSEFVPVLAKEGSLPVYDWKAVSSKPGEPTQTGNIAWCLDGQTGNCSAPAVDVPGPINITLNGLYFSDLVAKLYNQRKAINLKLISAGDAMDDCMHTDLSLKVSIQYIESL